MRTSRLEGMQALHNLEQRSFQLTLSIMELVRQIEPELPQALADRIITIAIDFGAGVSEALAHSTPKNKINKLAGARRATREMAFLLRLLNGIEMAAEPALRPMLEEAAALQDELTGLILRVRQEVERAAPA
ncbi:MAG: four helix bundle protein [Candidatus Hydrogenedentales bacterium]|jgi:four helix bundle protein